MHKLYFPVWKAVCLLRMQEKADAMNDEEEEQKLESLLLFCGKVNSIGGLGK